MGREMNLGARARAARKRQQLTLGDLAQILREFDVDTDPTMISRMEKGSRVGEPQVWGGIWRALGLPLRELYIGLGLPVQAEQPAGVKAEILAGLETMPEDAQRLVLGITRHAKQLTALTKRGGIEQEE